MHLHGLIKRLHRFKRPLTSSFLRPSVGAGCTRSYSTAGQLCAPSRHIRHCSFSWWSPTTPPPPLVSVPSRVLKRSAWTPPGAAHHVEPDNIREIRDMITAFCSKFPGTYWRTLDDEKQYPHEFVDGLSELGVLSMLIPDEYGGTGSTVHEASIALEEIHANGCNGAAAHAQMYVMGSILRHGSEEQKSTWLPQIASGLRLQAFGVSEPNNGTDTLSLETKAVYDSTKGGYIVNGQKIWTSRALQSDLMVLLARTGDSDTKRSKALSTFLVDMRQSKGNEIVIQPIDTMINHNTNSGM